MTATPLTRRSHARMAILFTRENGSSLTCGSSLSLGGTPCRSLPASDSSPHRLQAYPDEHEGSYGKAALRISTLATRNCFYQQAQPCI